MSTDNNFGKVSGKTVLSALAVSIILAGCDTSSGVGRFFAGTDNDAGPDEFGIVPTKPLEFPKEFTTLPEPTPGARNLTDPLPEQDAVAALGGRPAQLESTQINAGEGALLAAATRNGTAENIRTVLKQDDEKFRKKNGPKLIERLFRVNTYLKTYEEQTLAARKTNDLYRRSGFKTPTVPPVSEK
jgi:hypothetical protein